MGTATINHEDLDYFGLGWEISLVLALFPVTAWILGALTRFKDGYPILGILRLFGFGIAITFLDFLWLLTTYHIFKIDYYI